MKGKRKALSLMQGKGKKLDTPTNGKEPVAHRARTLEDYEPYPRVITDEERELFASMEDVSPHAPGYLEAYVRFGNHEAACSGIGIDSSTPRRWKQRRPDFAALREFIKKDVVSRWNTVVQALAMEGFEDRMYDADGELVGRRVRQDASFVRAFMASIDPERWGKQSGTDQSITIVIQDVKE